MTVKHFRCLEEVAVDIGGVTSLLGPNSAGKSSLLQALHFFFDGVQLEPEDVYGGGDGPVSVECVFDSLNDADREALGPYATGSQVVLRRSWLPGGEMKLTGRGRRFARFGPIRELSGREKTAKYRELRSAEPDLQLSEATRVDAVEQAMLEWEQGYPERCEEVDDEDASALFGYGPVGRSKLGERFRFVFVPGVQDAAEQAVEGKGTLLTRLLTAVAEQRAAANEELKSIEDDARERYVQAIDSSHGPVLAELGERLSEQMRRYVPTAEIKLEPAATEFKMNPPTVGLRGGEEQDITDLRRQGHGFQRAFVISVLEYLAESSQGEESESRGKPTLFLAVEEPELYQHPPRARHFYRTLLRIAEKPSVQVCYATHSPYFVSASRFDAVRIFRRARVDAGALGGAEVTAGVLDSVAGELPDSEVGDPRGYLMRTLSERFREAFFAKAVLVVEGPSDEAIFEACADLLGKDGLSGAGVAIVNVGKGSQPIALAILRSLGIPAYCVFDGDAGAVDGTICKQCNRGKTHRTSAKSSNRKVLRCLGATEVDFPDAVLTDTWACFHEQVEDAIPGFREAAAGIANEMGWRGKSPEAYAEAVRRLGGESLPEMLGQILDQVAALASGRQCD